MTLEGVKKFGRRVSRLSGLNNTHRSFVQRKRDHEIPVSQPANRAVASLIELAGADYAKGETDMAIYRLTRVLSTIEREHDATRPSALNDPPSAGPEAGTPLRKLLLRNELKYDYIPWRPQPYEELPAPMSAAESHCTTIHRDKHVHENCELTIRDLDSQVFEFSDMIERSFNLLTIGGEILEDDTTRFDELVPSDSPKLETVWTTIGCQRQF